MLGERGDPSFAGKVKKGIKANLMKELPAELKSSPEIDYTPEYILSAMIGILTYWFRNGEDMEKEKLIELMYKLMNSDGIKMLAKKIE